MHENKLILCERRYFERHNRNAFKFVKFVSGVNFGRSFFIDSDNLEVSIFMGSWPRYCDRMVVESKYFDREFWYDLTNSPLPYYAFYNGKNKKFEKILARPIYDQVEDLFFVNKVNNNTSSTPNLNNYGTNLIEKDYAYFPAVTREKKLDVTMTKLVQDKSIIYTGKPGIGKSALVEGLAYLIKQGNVPDALTSKVIYELYVNDLEAGTKYRGTFEEKVKGIIDEAKKNPNIILFIDELHTIIGAGACVEASQDFANTLKPYLARGEIKLIGCTTDQEYEKYFSKDPAFKSRFARIEVDEPQTNDLRKIVKAVIPSLEEKFGCHLESDEDLDILIAVSYRRKYDDPEYNPRLILNMLGDIYATAYLRSHSIITVDDIVEGLNMATNIYPSAIKKTQSDLLTRKRVKPAENKVIILPVGQV